MIVILPCHLEGLLLDSQVKTVSKPEMTIFPWILSGLVPHLSHSSLSKAFRPPRAKIRTFPKFRFFLKLNLCRVSFVSRRDHVYKQNQERLERLLGVLHGCTLIPV